MTQRQLETLWRAIHELFFSIPKSKRRQAFGFGEMNDVYTTLGDVARQHDLKVPEVPKEDG